MVYALAPESMAAAEANRKFNEFISDRELPWSSITITSLAILVD